MIQCDTTYIYIALMSHATNYLRSVIKHGAHIVVVTDDHSTLITRNGERGSVYMYIVI